MHSLYRVTFFCIPAVETPMINWAPELERKKKLIGFCTAGGDVSYVASRHSDINGLDFHYNPQNPTEIDQIAMCIPVLI